MRLRRIFARNLRAVRGARGMSQEALADAAKLDRTYISALERELYSASIDTVERLAQALSVPPDDLLADRSSNHRSKVQPKHE